MTSTAEIITGQTTVFNYLTKPILKTSGEALGER
jgi:adhesin transport system membrane fusion protein